MVDISSEYIISPCLKQTFENIGIVFFFISLCIRFRLIFLCLVTTERCIVTLCRGRRKKIERDQTVDVRVEHHKETVMFGTHSTLQRHGSLSDEERCFFQIRSYLGSQKALCISESVTMKLRSVQSETWVKAESPSFIAPHSSVALLRLMVL